MVLEFYQSLENLYKKVNSLTIVIKVKFSAEVAQEIQK